MKYVVTLNLASNQKREIEAMTIRFEGGFVLFVDQNRDVVAAYPADMGLVTHIESDKVSTNG